MADHCQRCHALKIEPAMSNREVPHGNVAAALDSLRDRIGARIRALPGAEVAVWYRDLGSADSLGVDADLSFHAASTMKVPVMIELFRQVDAGTLQLEQPLRIENRFTSIVDGSPFTLNANDDSDSTLYQRIGQSVPLRELNLRMITRSSNFATNLIIQLLDAPTITTHARALGARDIQVRRGVEDTKAFDAGLNNTTTAHDLGVLMAAIEQGRAGSPTSTAAMRSVLLQQEFNDEIPAGLPAQREQEPEETVRVDPVVFGVRRFQPGEFWFLRVTGDSMTGAGILDGDLVAVKQQATARDGQIVVALLEDEATVKRVYREPGGVRLEAENEAYEPIRSPDIKVIGRVVGVMRDL
mgnify:CR=1 FL=1